MSDDERTERTLPVPEWEELSKDRPPKRPRKAKRLHALGTADVEYDDLRSDTDGA